MANAKNFGRDFAQKASLFLFYKLINMYNHPFLCFSCFNQIIIRTFAADL